MAEKYIRASRIVLGRQGGRLAAGTAKPTERYWVVNDAVTGKIKTKKSYTKVMANMHHSFQSSTTSEVTNTCRKLAYNRSIYKYTFRSTNNNNAVLVHINTTRRKTHIIKEDR